MTSSEIKVGAVVVISLALVAAAIFLLGERNQLFVMKSRYSIHFPTVSGLEAGNPVKLNGVTVGRVEDVVLPERIEKQQLTVWISLDRRFAARVRSDSLARIKTLGLLGDKYIEISSGSATSAVIPSGGEIPAAPATDVERLVESGEDVVDNVAAISYSLRTILGRMERGEGLLGEMVVTSESGRETKQAVLETIDSLRSITSRIENGEGTIGALLMNEDLASRVESSILNLDAALAALDSGKGPLSALLHDASMRTDLQTALARTGHAAEDLSALSSDLRDGDGLLQKLLTDEVYATALSEDLRALVENLRQVSSQLNEGEGSLGQLLNDPHLYQAIDDVVVGIDESKLLRWLVRNRQKAGIKKRYRASSAPTSGSASAATSTAGTENPPQ